jgi:hypothetical protein
MVLYRNTQQDPPDIVMQSQTLLFSFYKRTYLFPEQRFLHDCAIILRRKIKCSKKTFLYRKRDSNSQETDSKSAAFTISPFLHVSRKQDSNLRPPASKAGKQPPLSSQKIFGCLRPESFRENPVLRIHRPTFYQIN